MEKDTSYYTKIIAKVIILALIIGGIFLSYKLAIFYIPFIIAMIIAACVEPIIKFFMKFAKMKRKIASIISLILLVVVIGGILVGGISKIITEATSLLSNMNQYFDNVYDWGLQLVKDVKEGNINIPEPLAQGLQSSLTGIIDGIKNIVISLLTGVINIISSVPNMITYSFITILAIIFICFDKEYIPNTIRSQIPKKWFERIKQIISEMCNVSIKYIKAEAKLSFICFIWVLIALNIVKLIGINVEYLLIMTLFIGIIDLLPLFGAGAVMLPWAGYSLIIGNVPLSIAIVVIWIIWAVIKQLLEPKMVSEEMGMHPIFTLVGMYTGFKLMGVLGLILGPIILIIIKNIFSELISKGVLKSFFEME